MTNNWGDGFDWQTAGYEYYQTFRKIPKYCKDLYGCRNENTCTNETTMWMLSKTGIPYVVTFWCHDCRSYWSYEVNNGDGKEVL